MKPSDRLKEIQNKFFNELESEVLTDISNDFEEIEQIVKNSKNPELTRDYLIVNTSIRICNTLIEKFKGKMDKDDLKAIEEFAKKVYEEFK